MGIEELKAEILHLGTEERAHLAREEGRRRISDEKKSGKLLHIHH